MITKAGVRRSARPLWLSADYGKAGIGIDFAQPGIEPDVAGPFRVFHGKGHRVFVMVMPLFHGLHQFGHQDPHHRGVLELVAAGAHGHVEPVQTGSVINGNPVVGAIIQVHDATGFVGDAHVRNTLGLSHGLGGPLFGEIGVVVVRVFDVLQGIAFRVFGADEDVVAYFRPGVAPHITV